MPNNTTHSRLREEIASEHFYGLLRQIEASPFAAESRDSYLASVRVAAERASQVADELIAALRGPRSPLAVSHDVMLDALRTTAGNIRSLGPAGAVGDSYAVWLIVVEEAIAAGERASAAAGR